MPGKPAQQHEEPAEIRLARVCHHGCQRRLLPTGGHGGPTLSAYDPGKMVPYLFLHGILLRRAISGERIKPCPSCETAG